MRTQESKALWAKLEEDRSDAAMLVAADWYNEHPAAGKAEELELALRWCVAKNRQLGFRPEAEPMKGARWFWAVDANQWRWNTRWLQRLHPRAFLYETFYPFHRVLANGGKYDFKAGVLSFPTQADGYLWLGEGLLAMKRYLLIPDAAMPVGPG